ncbi:unnamed protein product [Eruca vesicaria subsp. sativa]|uniref:Uncharacterized protein n=1 Tax=Eruca vesicaria subsp. sativa TaxID=29727 RepID=A0ABC8L5E5_ERUVS|nr:unnamed protein product [Eruca vesicaria subsp. sativa]
MREAATYMREASPLIMFTNTSRNMLLQPCNTSSDLVPDQLCTFFCKCGRLLAMDKKSSLILPLLHRTYQDLPLAANLDVCEAYHGGCSPED